MGALGFLKMFDKLDDIVYEPVKVICDACRQPLKNMDAANERKKMETESRLQREVKEFEMNLDLKRRQGEMQLSAEERKLNAEIDQMIIDKDFERTMKKAEFMKNYQEDMIKLSSTISNALGKMSIELRDSAQNLVLEKTKQYVALQLEAKDRLKSDLKDLNDLFGDDEESKSMMRKISFEQAQIILESTRNFMNSMKQDIDNMTANIDEITRQAIANTDKFLFSTNVSMPSSGTISYDDKKCLE